MTRKCAKSGRQVRAFVVGPCLVPLAVFLRSGSESVRFSESVHEEAEWVETTRGVLRRRSKLRGEGSSLLVQEDVEEMTLELARLLNAAGSAGSCSTTATGRILSDCARASLEPISDRVLDGRSAMEARLPARDRRLVALSVDGYLMRLGNGRTLFSIRCTHLSAFL